MKGAALILIATIIGVSCTAQTLKVTYTGTDNGLREMFKKMNSFPQNQGTSLFNEEEIKDRTTHQMEIPARGDTRTTFLKAKHV